MERIDDNRGVKTLDNSVIEQIVSFEWDMFQAVNAGGPRAVCQDDRATFEGMRRAQFQAWSPDVLASYLDDLSGAVLDGRNLVAEKYIHMMHCAFPSHYRELIKTIPMPGNEQTRLAREISDVLLAQTESLHKEYPRVSASGRPLCSVQDNAAVTSIETYQLGELLTYSEETLRRLKAHLMTLQANGRMLAREILENSVRHYGYAHLKAAEDAAMARIERDGLRSSSGCSGGDAWQRGI